MPSFLFNGANTLSTSLKCLKTHLVKRIHRFKVRRSSNSYTITSNGPWEHARMRPGRIIEAANTITGVAKVTSHFILRRRSMQLIHFIPAWRNLYPDFGHCGPSAAISPKHCVVLRGKPWPISRPQREGKPGL